MLSPSPLSLLCALLLCLPLAIVFTTTTNHGDAGDQKSPFFTIPMVYNPKNYQNIKLKKPISPPPPTPPPPPPPEDDESLLRLAAGVNPSPFPGKKLAFMFLTTTPLHLAPLWELYFNQTHQNLFNIYIHADPKYTYEPPFSGVFTNRVIHSKPSRRLSPTLISAARRLLAHALLHDTANSMFALVSSSCIPIHSFNFTYTTLIKSNKSFIEILKNEAGAYDRWAARGVDAMLPEVKLEDFRIGSQFWVLTRKHARLIVSDETIWRKFNQNCVRWDVCYPEEHYFPTLLSMQNTRDCVPATLTHVDWSGRFDGHPRMYNADEVGRELILSLRNGRPRYGDDGTNTSDLSVIVRRDQFLFARKFSAECLEPLMSIANDVIFKD